MDPATLIFLLALHLLASGAVLYLISRRLPPRSGVRAFAGGLALFGVAYAARLAIGLQAVRPPLAFIDGAMVVSVLLFTSGIRQFVGRDGWHLPLPAAGAAAFVVFDLAAVATQPPIVRQVLLNGTLAVLYTLLAGVALTESRRSDRVLRLPMRALALLAAGLALLNAARAVMLAVDGTTVLYHGTLAQVFYVYASVCALLFAPIMLWMVFLRQNAQLEHLATHDALTRALNRNGLDEALHRHFGAREHAPLRLLLLDIDHFKQVNDRHGHAAGDSVLRAVAASLLAGVRAGDFVARAGGDAAPVLTERLRSLAEALPVPIAGRTAPVRCTLSVGVSNPIAESAQFERGLREADAALYRAKQAGRNRVEAAAPLP